MPEDKSIDKLTRLLNDTFLEEDFTREIKRADRYKRPLTFLLIDPGVSEDDFPQVGYLALKKLAGVARELTRYLDIKVRLRNCILILLPETNYQGALKVAAKIYQKISDMTFREFPDVKLSGKIGVASFPEDGIDKNSILYALEKDLEIPLQDKVPSGLGPKVENSNAKSTDSEEKAEIFIDFSGSSGIDGMMKL